jgi:hypothetical protein
VQPAIVVVLGLLGWSFRRWILVAVIFGAIDVLYLLIYPPVVGISMIVRAVQGLPLLIGSERETILSSVEEPPKLILIAAVLVAARVIWRIGTRFHRKRRDEIVLKDKPPVLLLRSFVDDVAGIPANALLPRLFFRRKRLEEMIGDKGYHSNQTLVDLDTVGIRAYVAEPARGRRDWSRHPEAQAPVYGNRRRTRGARGRRLMRRRGELVERSFAHLYDTGGMRRTHLRGHTNILKRLLIHAGGFNLGLVMRHQIGVGTPRGLQGRPAIVIARLLVLLSAVRRRWVAISIWQPLKAAVRCCASPITSAVNFSVATTFTTGC